MPPTCTICRHDRRAEIDAALMSDRPLRAIAGQYGTGKSALARHKEHLSGTLVIANKAAKISAADDLLASIQDLHQRSLAILEGAADNPKIALAAIREARECLRVLIALAAELREREHMRNELNASTGYKADIASAAAALDAILAAPEVA